MDDSEIIELFSRAQNAPSVRSKKNTESFAYMSHAIFSSTRQKQRNA